MINIDLLNYRDFLNTRKENDMTLIFCEVRKKWVVLTPEEVVRQLFILHCTREKIYPIAHFSVEKSIMVNNLPRRYDLAVHDREGRPNLLVECKAPHITLDQDAVDQLARYNLTMSVRYLIVTNGMSTVGFEIDHINSNYKSIDYLPAV